jgi:ppGpp synthetase/RelA/SpoT-type nucleotidyltranferase
MNIQEYKEHKRALYEKFAKTVKDILSSAIKGAVTKSSLPYRLQQIQFRAKTNKALENKLKQRGIADSDNIEGEIKDLAGCRVIFYYNGDVNAFLNSGIVTENFNVDWDETKIHYPTDEVTTANDLYTANHYIVELKSERLVLPEYSEFGGLRCEIQVHTVLNHAFSETTHDIIYKKSEAVGFGSRVLESIDNQLAKVMQDFLRPAGYAFQNIQIDYQRFIEGKELIDGNIIEKIGSDINNNQRYELLKKYKEYVLPNFDDYSEELPEILKLVKTATSVSRRTDISLIDTPFGPLPGITPLNILEVCLDILRPVQYVNVEETFSTLIELYANSSTDKERDKISEHVSKLASYNIDIWQKCGIYIQSTLVSILETWDKDTLKSLKGLAIKVCSTVLSPTLEGTSSTYEAVIIRQGNLPGNTEVASVRGIALKILKEIYILENSEPEKRQVIAAFNTATSTPYSGEYSDELLVVILKDCNDIVEFYISILPTEQYEILESIEHKVLFLYRRAKDIIKGKRAGKKAMQQSSILLESIKQFKDQLNSNNKFVVYKTLVGFESVFPDMWGDESWDIEKGDEYRESTVRAYVESLNDENKEFWEKIIIRCTQTKSNDWATFPNFGKFLNLLSETHSEFMFDLLDKYESDISGFLTMILDGLLKGSGKEKAKLLIHEWIEEGKHLWSCARVCEYNSDLGEDVLSRIFDKAKEHKDTDTIIQIISAVASNYSRDRKHMIAGIFLPAINELTKQKDSRWINVFGYRKEHVIICSDLTEAECDIILASLFMLHSIDSNAEKILALIAKKIPEKVINFFGKRIDIEETAEPGSRYCAIPFQLRKLVEPLSANPNQTVDSVSKWYDDNYGLFMYRGARLLKAIFPTFPKNFEDELRKLVDTKQENNLLIVMAILRNYEGNTFLHGVCQELILALPEGSQYLDEIRAILNNTGVVSGEFGLVDAYQRKKTEVECWLTHEEERIRNFAKQYIKNLDKLIAVEKHRAEEGIELRKHKYGAENEE